MRLLTLSRVGLLLTNESICEIMQSTLRICFEPRLSELLRKTAQHCLNDMVQLLFTRLPSFTIEEKPLLKKLKMRTSGDGKSKKKRSRVKKSPSPRPVSAQVSSDTLSVDSSAVVTSEEIVASPVVTEKSFISGDVLARSPVGSVQDLSLVSDNDTVTSDLEQETTSPDTGLETNVEVSVTSPGGSTDLPDQADDDQKETVDDARDGLAVSDVAINVTSPGGTTEVTSTGKPQHEQQEFTNEAGVMFETTADVMDSEGALVPYGLPAVYELLRFLASLINPHEPANTETQINIGLSLVATALEVGVEALVRFPSLLSLVQDSLCRSFISLLQSERVGVFSSSLRCCYLMFSVLRSHLKLQLECFLVKLSELISSDSVKVIILID